jgi:hypothetical protein
LLATEDNTVFSETFELSTCQCILVRNFIQDTASAQAIYDWPDGEVKDLVGGARDGVLE